MKRYRVIEFHKGVNNENATTGIHRCLIKVERDQTLMSAGYDGKKCIFALEKRCVG